MNTQEELLKVLAQEENEKVDIKAFLFKLFPFWYWFLISVTICGACAYLYVKFAPAKYSVSSLILIKEKEADGMNLENMFNNFQLKSDVKIENHIGILTSFSINWQVIKNLGWQVSWYKPMLWGDYNLYGKEPFSISYDASEKNQQGVQLSVKCLSKDKYQVSADAEVNINGVLQKIDFEQIGEFGEKFSNAYFNFILSRNENTNNDEYYFCFNNINNLALGSKRKLKATAVNKNANLILLQVEGQSPEAEISYLNELTNVYIQFGLSDKNLTSENTIHFIEQQLSDIVDTLKTTSNDFSTYRSTNKVFDLGQKASLVVEKLGKLETQKSMAQMQLNYYENLQNYLDNGEKFKKMVAPSVVGINDATLNSLVVKMIELYSRKESLSFSLQDKNPGIRMIDNELDYAKKSLVENLKNLVFNTKQEFKSIQEDIADLNKQLENYPKTEQDLINIKRMVDLNNDLYTFLLQKRAEAEITKASNIPDVKVLDPASWATSEKTGPRKMLILAIGIFLGLVIPVLVIVIRDYFDETVHTEEDIQKLTSVPIAATIPHNPYEGAIPVLKHPRSVIAESFRELRTKLDYLCREEGTKVIGVQSVVPGEGKSFISLNLSAIIALNNKKVVLIGADMRKPTLHKLLGINNNEGLSTYLIGQHSLEQVINSTSIPRLDFIPSGVIPPNPAELLGTKEFENLIEILKKNYDTIILDNAPISLVTDGTITGQYTGLDLFVSRQGYTHKKLIETIEQVSQNNNNTGIVLNDLSPKKYNGYSYYKYGYYKYGYRKAYYGSSEEYFDLDTPKKKFKKSKKVLWLLQSILTGQL